MAPTSDKASMTRWWAAIVLLSGCGMRYWVCDEVDPSKQLPPKLSQTELYTDVATDTLAPGVVSYAPAYELWSDGASKRRWIALPPNSRVDTSDMNSWVFPPGTKLWKEFTRDGVRVETRILSKLGPSDDDWVAASYVWRADQRDAELARDAVVDALGTPHDVPAPDQCAGCHGGRKSRVLGFSAVQLAEQTQLASLLTQPVDYSIPGTPEQRAALGYVYANCAHCHNQTRPAQSGKRCYDPRRKLDFSLDVRQSKVEQTGIYQTGIDVAFQPGRPGDSALLDRMRGSGIRPMPPLARERIDEQGVSLLEAWIAHP